MKILLKAAGLYLALVLGASGALGQVSPGTSPLSGVRGGTNNAFMQFTGPSSSLKTFTLPNVSDTIAVLGAAQTFTGAKTFNTASGDSITINPPANSTNKGISITQTSPNAGSVTGPLSYNQIDITHQLGVTGAEPQAAGLRLNMNIGGTSVTGQPMIGIYSNVQKTIAGVGAGGDKIGLVGSAYLDSTDTSSGYYGENPVCTMASGGNGQRCVGIEAATDIRAGGSAIYRYSVMAANYGAGQGSTLDSAMVVGNIGTSGGAFKNMIALTNSLGQAPMDTTGSLFISDTAATVANVFNMSNVTVTGNILNFPNVTLSGSGHLALPDVKVTGGPATITTGQGTIGASANSGLIVQGFGAVFDLQLLNKTGGTACVVATGTTTLNCNTVTITNALGVASGGTGDTGTAWTSYTPTITPGSGSFTSASATGGYKTVGKTVFFTVTVTITTAGTGTGVITLSTPTGTTARTANSSCMETVKTGSRGSAIQVAAVSTMTLQTYNAGTFVSGDGTTITCTGVYEQT